MIHDFDAEDDHDHHPFPVIQVNAIAVVLVNFLRCSVAPFPVYLVFEDEHLFLELSVFGFVAQNRESFERKTVFFPENKLHLCIIACLSSVLLQLMKDY